MWGGGLLGGGGGLNCYPVILLVSPAVAEVKFLLLALYGLASLCVL